MTEMTSHNNPDFGHGDVLVIDLIDRKMATVSDPGITSLTERHHLALDFDMRPATDLQIEKALSSVASKPVVLTISVGLPSLTALRLGRSLTKQGSKVFLYWPRERSIELLDKHRFWSYFRHTVFVRLVQLARAIRTPGRPSMGVLSGIRNRRRIRKILNVFEVDLQKARLQSKDLPLDFSSAAKSIFGSDVLNSDDVPYADNPIRGAGAYVRLDYWASLKAGGSYGHTCFLAKAAAAVSEDFECLFANRFELLDDYGVRQTLLPYQPNFVSSADLVLEGKAFEKRLGAELDRLKPVYVYERSVLGNFATARWCAQSHVPYILEYNGSELAMARSFGTPYDFETELEAIEHYTMQVATLINVISEPVAESLVARGIPRDRILVNPNAVDPDVYAPMSDGDRASAKARYGFSSSDIVVGFCGTFGGWHGIETLAAAMPEICAADSRIKFLLIGDGNLKHLVDDIVASHSLGDRVCDLGLVPQLEGAAALSVCDVLVAPHAQNIDGKTFFGSPTKLFEYMATGAGIVCSDLAQLGEVMRPALSVDDVRQGREPGEARGVLVAPGDVQDFVAAVSLLAANAELRSALGKNARSAVVDNYTWDIHVENIWRAIAGLPLRGYAQDKVAD